MSSGAVIEKENPKYHNEPTHEHVIYVGSVMSELLGFNEDFIKEFNSDHAYNFFRKEPTYIDNFLNVDEHPEVYQQVELVLKREIFASVFSLLTALKLTNQETTALYLWAYLHDSGKILRPEIKLLEHNNGNITIKKSNHTGTTLKEPSYIYPYFYDNQSDYNQYEVLDSLNEVIFTLIEENGLVGRDIIMVLRDIHVRYEKMTGSLKGYGSQELLAENDQYTALALIALVTDELGKGILFNTYEGHEIRVQKYRRIINLLNYYV